MLVWKGACLSLCIGKFYVKDVYMFIHINNSPKAFIEKNVFALKFCTVSTVKKNPHIIE